MTSNKKLNEALPAVVGGGNAVQNGLTNTQPSREMVSNIENSTIGGVDSVVSDTRHMFDFVNGKGDYGVFGRDFSYSISSLALLNPYAAGAVIGVIGAGSMIYGIMTSAYVRSKQTLRRLRKIHKEVLGEGYRIDEGNSFFLGKMFNLFTNRFGKVKSKRIGVNQFYEELTNVAQYVIDEATALKIPTADAVRALKPGEYENKRAGINHILSYSYVEFYIPSEEISEASDRYKNLITNNRFNYDKNVEETYDKLMKRMNESTVNAPLFKRRDDYLATINDLGESLVNAFDTKMGYALKRGGNRAVSCSRKLHATWKDMMGDIKSKLDARLADVMPEDATTKTKTVGGVVQKLGTFQQARDLVEAMYKLNKFPLTIDAIGEQLYVGSMFMQRSNSLKDETPILLSLDEIDKKDWDNGIIRMKVVNSDIVAKGKHIPVPIKYLKDNIAEPEPGKAYNVKSGRGRTTDRYVRMGEYDMKGSGTVKERCWYRVNYSAAQGPGAVNGMWSAVVYVIGIVDGGPYGKTGTKFVQYRYANFPIYGGPKGGGTVQMVEEATFNSWIISEIREYSKINRINDSIKYDNSEIVLNEGLWSIYDTIISEVDRTGLQHINEDNETDSESIDADSYSFANKSTYTLLASDKGAIVYTQNPVPGKVLLYEAYNNKKEFSWEEWEKLIPVETSFIKNPYGNPDVADILLDDNIDDVVVGDEYPLKYGAFEKKYMQEVFSPQYTTVFNQYSGELMKIDIVVDESGKKCLGLCESEGYYGKYTLRDPDNFKMYLRMCIADEILIKDEDEMNREMSDGAKSSNESFSVKDIKRLFEGEVINEDNMQVNAIDNSMTQTNSAEAKIGDTAGSVENKGNGNFTIINNNSGLSIDDILKLVDYMLAHGCAGASIDDIKKQIGEEQKRKSSGNKGKSDDSGNGGDNKPGDNNKPKKPINGIPDVVRKVCIDILRRIKKFATSFHEGGDRTKFNNPPRIFRGKKDAITELLSGNHNEEYGIYSIDDIDKIKSSKPDKNLDAKWLDNYIVDDNYKDAWEPVYYFDKDAKSAKQSDSSTDKGNVNYYFLIQDKYVAVSDIKKFDEKLGLIFDGVVYRKGGDQENKHDLDKANVSIGEYYELPLDVLKGMHEEQTTETSNESVKYSDDAFYKLFEDDNNADDSENSTSQNLDSMDAERVLVMVKSLKDGKVELNYLKDGSLISDFVSVSATAKVDMDSFVYNVQSDASISFDYDRVYALSKEGYDFISKGGFITDRTNIVRYNNDAVLVMPRKALLETTSNDFMNPALHGGIRLAIGGAETSIIPLLYVYSLFHTQSNVLTSIDWISKVADNAISSSLLSQYYKMSKEEFDKSFGLILKTDDKSEETQKETQENAEGKGDNTDNTTSNGTVTDSYHYAMDYLYKLYEADENDTSNASDEVKYVYIEITMDMDSYDATNINSVLNAKFTAKCKTDVELKNGDAPKETEEFTFNEAKLPMDMNLEVLDEMPEGWDTNKETSTEDAAKEKEVPIYPDEAVRPYPEAEYNNLTKLHEYLNNVNLLADSSMNATVDKGDMVNFVIQKYCELANNRSAFASINNYAEKIKSMTPGNVYNKNIQTEKECYDFIVYVLERFLTKDWNKEVSIENDKDVLLMYVNKDNKWISKSVKVEKDEDEYLYIAVKSEDGDVRYRLPKNNANYLISESAYGYPTIKYKSENAYMKYMLYGVPLKESIVFDFGNPKSFNSILEILISTRDNLLQVMEWANGNEMKVKITQAYVEKLKGSSPNNTSNVQTTPQQGAQPVNNALPQPQQPVVKQAGNAVDTQQNIPFEQ